MNTFIFPDSVLCPDDKKITAKTLHKYTDYYLTKYDICKKQNPNRIAEIGVRAGYSAWCFLQACPKAEYFGFDANNGKHGGAGGQDGCYKKWAEKILSSYKFHLIDVDTQLVSSLDLRDIDFFHVDGDHTRKGVQHDLDLAYRCMAKNGLILVDDITYLKPVADGCKDWLQKMEKKVTTTFIPSLRGELLIHLT
jgi:predicted O-methyltransferase YrrM